MERHYGMDWLRIGAFGLLILYHVGMFFGPWDWHVKTAAPADWVAIPMLATHAWRLTLLFVVSGFASRALLARGGGALGGFVANRSARLGIPLIVAIVVVVPVQPWIELVGKHGYPHGFGYFWVHDYFRFGALTGIVMPTWQHLWFVVYLLAYTLLLAVGLAAFRGKAAQVAFDRVLGGAQAWLIPLGWWLFVALVLFRGARETHDLFGDIAAHLRYFPAFLFGFGLAGSPAVRSAIGRWWPAAAAVAVAGYAVRTGVELGWPGAAQPPRPVATLMIAAEAAFAWSAVIALVGIADQYWNRDHRWRPMLVEAVFPFYIIHQSVIVAVGWALLPYRLPMAAEFAILVAATVAGCWTFYLAGRRIGWLRPLIGLRALAKPAASAREPVSI